ncbi:MAG: hypothetical protein ACJ78M_03165 [Gemmatimonadaceae bacterium]
MRNRFLILAALVPFAAASGQGTVEAASVPAIVLAPRNVISIQPINAMLTAYSAEYEHQTGGAVTVGVGGTYFEVGDGLDEVKYKSADLKLRYYPNGAALMGFSFGGTAGFSTLTGSDISSGDEVSASGPSVGVLLEYQWLMGASRNFSVALGAGAKAVFVKDNDVTSDNFTTRYPTVRISVGYAF